MVESPFSEIARIVSFNAINSEVFKVILRLPEDHHFSFTAGQYLLLVLDDDDKRPFSIASAPGALPTLELHIRDVPENEFITKVISRLRLSETIGIEGPLGKVIVSLPINREITFIVGGTGFAPAKAIIENMLDEGVLGQVNLFRGARSSKELYEMSLLDQWQKLANGFNFTNVISEPDPSWQGATGLVHQVAMEQIGEDLKQHEIYIAGSVEMVMAVYHDLLTAGINKSQIHADMLDILREQGELD